MRNGLIPSHDWLSESIFPRYWYYYQYSWGVSKLLKGAFMRCIYCYALSKLEDVKTNIITPNGMELVDFTRQPCGR